MWSTKSINQLALEINSGRKLKSVLRDISINNLLNPNDTTTPIFPFYLTTNGSTLNTLLRAGNILFDYTNEEIQKIMYYKENPLSLYEYISNTEGNYAPAYRIGDLGLKYINITKENRFNLLHCTSELKIIRPIIFSALHYAIFNSEKYIFIYSDNRSMQSSLILKSMLDSVPFFVSPGIVSIKSSKFNLKVKFDNGSVIEISNSDNSRLVYTDYLIIDNTISTKNTILYKIANITSALARPESRINIITNNKDLFNSSPFSNFVKMDFTPEIRQDIINDILDINLEE